MFFNIAWGKGGAWELGTGDLERIDSFFKSSKDLLHYSMLFLEMSQVFLTSIVDVICYVTRSLSEIFD